MSTLNSPHFCLENGGNYRYRYSLLRFQGEIVFRSQRIGEIDVELEKVIIEVTHGQGGRKVGQARRLQSATINPKGKPIIIFGPNVTRLGRIRAIEQTGAFFAKTLSELDDLVEGLNR